LGRFFCLEIVEFRFGFLANNVQFQCMNQNIPQLRICLLLLLFFMGMIGAQAQNWHPFPGGGPIIYRYEFQSGADTLFFAARIDSVKLEGADSAYYLYRVDKPAILNDTLYDANGMPFVNGQYLYQFDQDHYLGQKMLCDSLGFCRFVSSHGDTFALNTRATLGSTWDWQSGVTATVASVQQGLVFGVLDSLKTISLSSGKELILSKEHGFVKTFSFLKFMEFGGLIPNIDFFVWGMPALGLGGHLPNTEEYYSVELGDAFCWKKYHRESLADVTMEYRNTFYPAQVPCSKPTFVVATESYAYFQAGIPIPPQILWYQPLTTYTPVCDTTLTIAPDSLLELLPFEYHAEEPFLMSQYYFQRGQRKGVGPYAHIGVGFQWLDTYIDYDMAFMVFESAATKDFTEGFGEVSSSYYFSNDIYETTSIYAYTKDGITYGTCENLQALGRANPSGSNCSIYPNPAQDAVQIELTQTSAESQVFVQLRDASGKAILRQEFSGNAGPMQLDLQSVAPGLYFLEITQGEQAPIRRKLVVAR
jgi:Secretion system C-terminal sorting domain